MGLAYGIGGLINTPAGAISGSGAPPSSFVGQLGQQYFDTSVTPPQEYIYNGQTWALGGNLPATDTTYGIVLLTDNNEPVATQVYVDAQIQAVVVGAVPAATTTTQGIVELATDAQVVTPYTTDVANTCVQPSNITAMFAEPPPIGATTPASGAFTDLAATGVGTGNIITSDTASSMGVTGAGIDLTLSSAAGRVVVNGEEAAADAVRILSAAGGLDVNTALQINIDSSQAAADAVRIISSAATGGIDVDAGTNGITVDSTGVLSLDASGLINMTSMRNNNQAILISTSQGGIDITATGVAGNDIDITGSGTSVNVTSTENAAECIYLHANGGLLETIRLHADQGTGVASVNIGSDVGGITIAGGLGTADAVNITASTAGGGIDIDSSTGGFDVLTTGAVSIDSSLASNVTVTGASVDLTVSSVGGSVVITGTEAAVDAVQINGNTGAGGVDINAGTGGITVDSGGLMSLDAAGVVNLTTTGAFDITVNSTAGSVIVTGAEAAVDAVQLNATTAGGGIDINGGTGGITVDSGGLLSLDAAGVVNLTTTGAFDITVNSTAGSVILTGAEAAADAVQLNALTGGGGIDINASSGGITMDTTAAISLDSATASNFTVTGAADLTLSSSAGAVNVTSGEANADSINVTSAGGMSIVATGAAAKDTLITNTNGSMTLTAGESVSDAMNFTASGAASGMTLTAGTNGITLSSGIKVKVTAVVTGVDASPYTLLGTDYFVGVDTGAGVMTITLPASPATGRAVTIYDAGGAAAGSNITIDGNGKNIAAGGTAAASKAINTAYESYNLVYNGTLWLGQNIV